MSHAHIDIPNRGTLLTNPAIVISICLIAVAIIPLLKKHMKDPYGLFHLSFNKLPSDKPDKPPQTEWLNLGYWKDTKIFPEACKALAMKLISVANLREKGRILDVGHGTGESLILLLTEPSIPQPSHLVGITSLPLHHERSLSRVQKLQSSNPKANETEVELFGSDAIYNPVSPGSSPHPMDPNSHYIFDTILALDCAYHFRTRRLFLEQSLVKLSPGGSIGLADVCIESSSFPTRVLTKLLKMMPEENVISEEGYVKQMGDIGYVDVQLEDVTQYVVPGFVEFLKARGWSWWLFASVFGVYVKAGMRIVIVRGTKPNL